MTKLLFTLCTFLFLISVSAYAQMKPTVNGATIQKTLEADNALLKAFETGDVSKLDNYISADFLNHTGGNVGVDSLKSGIKKFHASFKPAKMESKRQLTDGEYVADWVRYTGVNPAMVIEGIEMTKYHNGKALEHWFFPAAQPVKD